jgi:histidyl-tRNA synthetase
LKKQFRYADRKGIPYIAIQGPDEREKGLVTLRSMSDGVEVCVPIAEIGGYIK